MSTLSRADSSQVAEERLLEEQQKGRSSKKTKKKKKGQGGQDQVVHYLHCIEYIWEYTARPHP